MPAADLFGPPTLESEATATPLIPPYALPLLLALIVAAGGFWAYDTRFNYQTISFEFSSWAPAPITDYRVNAFNEEHQLTATLLSPAKEMRVLNGTYSFEIIAPAFHKKTIPSTRMEGTQTLSAELEPFIDAQLAPIEFPAIISPNQRIPLSLSIQSNLPYALPLHLQFSKEITDAFDVNQNYSFTLSPGPNTIPISLNARNRFTKLGQKITGTLFIQEEPLLTQTISFTPAEFRKTELVFSERELSFGSIAAGTSQQKIITLSNQNPALEAGDLQLSVQITSSRQTPPATVQTWVEATPSAIPSIQANGGRQEIQIKLSVPIAAPNDSILGKITAQNEFLSASASFSFQVNAAVSELSLENIPSTLFVERDSNLTEFTPLTRNALLSNGGKTTLESITLATQCDLEPGWLSISPAFLETLAPQQTQNLTLTVSPPAHANDSSSLCTLYLKYTDPLAPTERKEIKQDVLVQLKTKPTPEENTG
ncbi:MAG: hypothetical protein HY917_03200 [Candidatus Diapherotrites archaeon]|nr:hypothetical protein [Candidatus Diapherotrites archaeon]